VVAAGNPECAGGLRAGRGLLCRAASGDKMCGLAALDSLSPLLSIYTLYYKKGVFVKAHKEAKQQFAPVYSPGDIWRSL
jgi:hypothetical protein